MLTPLSLGYAGVVGARTRWWRGRAWPAPCPTISVGNLTVGGNGKTPFTLFLGERLSRRGYRVAIVSRGYGRRRAGALLVADRGALLSDTAAAGDEPAMMARRFDGPIAVARRRFAAIQLLVRHGPLDAIILDDAFQHLRLRRDLDLLLVSEPGGLGNGWLLPAGPLREPPAAMGRADAVILLARSAAARRPPAFAAGRASPTRLRAALQPISLVRAVQGAWVESPLTIAGRRAVVVSGLADPSGFHAMLRELGAELIRTLEFADHHRYTPADWRAIRRAATEGEIVLTTEKDLVKLEAFSPALASLYAVRVAVVMEAADEARLFALIAARLEKTDHGAASIAAAASPARPS